MMSPIRIVALVEHVDRELDVLCLVKHKLQAEHGINLEIYNFYADAPLLLNSHAPHIVLLPFCYAKEDMTLSDYVDAWPETRFYNLAWEQILYPSNQTLKSPRDAFAKMQVTHFAWSQVFVDFLIQSGVPKDNITLIGHWLYGLYAEKYRNYFLNRDALAKRFGLDANKRWIFVPENYRWAFFSDSKLKKLAQKGVERDALFEMRDYCQKSMKLLLEWCQKLAREQGVEVIFRPRPATSKKELGDFIIQQAGITSAKFHVIKDLSAREWVLASDLVVSSYSTVMIEAAIAGKDIMMVEPTPIPAVLRYEWCDLLHSVNTQQAFIARALQNEKSNDSAILKAWAEKHFFPNTDPLEKLTRTIAGLTSEVTFNTPSAKPGKLHMPRWLGLVAPLLPPRLKHRLFQLCVKHYSFNAASHEKDFFSQKNVGTRVKGWAKALRS